MNRQGENQRTPLTGRCKVQLTVRLKDEVYRAARETSARRRVPLAVIVAEAAAQALLPPPEASPETNLVHLSKRLLSRMETLERSLGRELFATRELLAQFVRAYFNHTPAIPDSERAAASLSGRLRFVRLAEQVNLNAGQGISILNELEAPDAP